MSQPQPRPQAQGHPTRHKQHPQGQVQNRRTSQKGQAPQKGRPTASRRGAPKHAADTQRQRNRKATKQKSVLPIVLACIVALVVAAGELVVIYALVHGSQSWTGGAQQSAQAAAPKQSAQTHATGSAKDKQDKTADKTKDATRVVVGAQEQQDTKESAAEAQEQKDTKKTATGTQEQKDAKTEASKNVVEPATIEVMMIGDILMHNELVDSGVQGDGTYDFDFIYSNIGNYIDAADLRILNQETVMGDPSIGYHLTMGEVGPIMNTPTALADTEARYGFNAILKATNHTLDLGYSGLGHELDYWKYAYPNIPVLGVNNPNASSNDKSQDYVNNVYIYEKDGLKVGILNYTWATNENVDWDTDPTYVSYMSEKKIRADVRKAREAGAEMLIACPHWGVEYDTEPSNEEMTYSKLFCELGVDLIFGCHPHILQQVELLQNSEGHKTVCFYSMGNFVAASTMNASSLIGGIARATLHREADGTYAVTAASLVPTVICHTYGPNMSAFPLAAWTDDLTAISNRPTLTTDYAYSFCANVLGGGFDESTGVYTLDLSGKPRTV